MRADTKDNHRDVADGSAGPADVDDRPALLLVDDDESCRWALGRAFERRGYAVRTAATVAEALEVVEGHSPEFAVIDLRMPGSSGLALVAKLKQADPNTRIVMLTGYASVATAVEAIKLGAIDYLVKPVDADAIEAAFGHSAGNPELSTQDQPLSVDRLAWEHIQRVLAQHNGNISATARALGMHRRTLQRKLNKRPVRR